MAKDDGDMVCGVLIMQKEAVEAFAIFKRRSRVCPVSLQSQGK